MLEKELKFSCGQYAVFYTITQKVQVISIKRLNVFLFINANVIGPIFNQVSFNFY